MLLHPAFPNLSSGGLTSLRSSCLEGKPFTNRAVTPALTLWFIPLQPHSHLSRNHLTRPSLCARLPHCRPTFQAEDKRHQSPYIKTLGRKSPFLLLFSQNPSAGVHDKSRSFPHPPHQHSLPCLLPLPPTLHTE